MLKAWKHLKRIERERLRLTELPIAQLSSLLANVNRDPKKGKPFGLQDFCLFAEDKQEGALPAVVAAIAMQLKHEGIAPPLLISVWDQVLASLKEGAPIPPIRALHSDDSSVWVLAPKWEGCNIRGGLVLVRGRVSGEVVLRDLDKSLMRYRVQVPERRGFGWMEVGCLLLGLET